MPGNDIRSIADWLVDGARSPEDMRRAMAQEWETMQELAKALNLRQ